ncbi:MAG: ATPase [SAR202 cluster bacterium]|nr:ATPase [SAR202 cluster bacterium]
MTTPSSQPGLPTPAGRVIPDGDHATLEFKRTVQHPPAAVWDALTKPEQLTAWLARTATVEGRSGGSVDVVAGATGTRWSGRILTWVKPFVLEYEWNAEAGAGQPHAERAVVRWELIPSGAAATALTVTQRRLSKQAAAALAPAMHTAVDRLEAHLAKTSPPDWSERQDAVRGAYPS